MKQSHCACACRDVVTSDTTWGSSLSQSDSLFYFLLLIFAYLFVVFLFVCGQQEWSPKWLWFASICPCSISLFSHSCTRIYNSLNWNLQLKCKRVDVDWAKERNSITICGVIIIMNVSVCMSKLAKLFLRPKWVTSLESLSVSSGSSISFANSIHHPNTHKRTLSLNCVCSRCSLLFFRTPSLCFTSLLLVWVIQFWSNISISWSVTMSDNVEKCVRKDLSRMMLPTHRDWPGVWLEPKGDNLLELKGYIMGQEDTPFYGGKFEIEVSVPSDFPSKPPKFHLLTPIWHPNIDSAAGEICLNILQQSWTTNMSLGTAMLCIQLFFDSKFNLFVLIKLFVLFPLSTRATTSSRDVCWLAILFC